MLFYSNFMIIFLILAKQVLLSNFSPLYSDVHKITGTAYESFMCRLKLKFYESCETIVLKLPINITV